ncbi:MAG: replicative DNA helicase [Bifidobacteriaceae bacterium]|nr:replicative DNA helicase [Bifidobacteriaceae bacterium]
MTALTNYDEPSAELGRIPPQDVAAEMSVLGACLLSKDAIADVVEVIEEEDFYKPAHETIFSAIKNLYGAGEPVDQVTVAAELTKNGAMARIGGVGYLHDLAAVVPTAANASYYASIVRDRAVLRRLVDAGTRITQLGYATDGQDATDAVNTAQAEIYAVGERRTRHDYQVLGSDFEDFLEQLDTAKKLDGLQGVPTGFTALDNVTGGLQAGQMIIVAARPAMGKSTLGIDFARSAAIKHGMTSVIFSLEMSRNEILQRIVSAETRVFLSDIRHGRLDDTKWDRISRRHQALAEAPLFIDDSPNMSLVEIRAKCRRLKQRHDLKLVIIDYLQLMSSGKRVESRQQEVSEFSRALKLLAKELDVPIVAISQLNRNPEKRDGGRPQMSDLRESGSLEQDADMVLLVHRNSPQESERNPGEADNAKLLLVKHRNGPTADIDVLFLGHIAHFEEPASDI